MKIQFRNIPKFQTGNKLWYQNLIGNDYDPNKYLYNYDTTSLVDGDMSDTLFNPWVSQTAGYDKGRYVPTTGHGAFGINGEHYNYTKGVEGQNYYQKFGNDLLDENGNFTEMGREWAKAVDALIPASNHLARFYDDKGNLRTRWTTGHKDAHGRAPQTYNNLRDYVNAIRNDQILGARHNVFLNKGKRYFYKDKDGNEHWVDPNQISNYTVSQNPIRSNWNDDHTIYWDDYQLIGPDDQDPSTNQGSIVASHKDGKYGFDWNKINQGLSAMLPNLLEAGRLAGSLYNNGRIYDAKLKGIRPNLKQTYLTHRQVVGDEATKQGYYRRAAEGQTKAGRPFTADADRQMAYMMEARRVGDELKAQGDLADNQEIRRTSDESNQHQWANTQRRTETANANIEQINYANAAKQDLLAQKYAADWSSWDNFLKSKEYRMRQKRAEDEAIQKQIWALKDQDDLINDTTLAQLQKEANDAWNNDAPDKMDKIQKYRAYQRKKQIEMLENSRNRGTSGIWWAGSGMKITHKKKDDLLYKSTRDVVEHFRKMSKMSDDSTQRSRSRKSFKLTPHPSGKARRMQQGGVAPFTVFTPVALGGETSTQVSSTGASSASSSSSKSSDEKETLDLIKSLFQKVEGLPIDVNSVYKSMSDFLAKSQAFGTELSTNDIASMYLQSMQQLSGIKHSKEVYDKAKAVATQNDALGEFAVTSNGRYVVQDQETGKLSIASLQEIQEKGLNPLTNEQLINLRAYSPDLAFAAGDNIMELVVNNGIGMSKIAEAINKLKGTLGSTESTIEGYTKHESNQIKKGLELLTEAPAGDYKYTQYTKEQQQQMQHAYNYIQTMLPNNMKAVLRINAYSQGVTPDVIIKSLLNANSSTTSRLEFDAVTGKAAKDANGNSKVGGDDGLKLDAPTALIYGKGYQDNIEFNPGTSYAVTVNAHHSGFQKKSGENMGSGITMQEATTSTLDQVLDWNKATLGGSRLNPTGYNRIMINNNDVVGVDLPVGQDKSKPDFTMLKKLQLLDQELLKRGIEDTSNNWQQVNQICQEIGLPSKYKSDGHLNDYSWNRFAAFQVTADDSVLINKDAILDDILGIVEDDNVRSQYEQIIQKDNKNYKLGSGFLGFGKQALYQGTVFVPIKSNLTAAALSGGQNITMSQATDLELRERGYDQSKAATYKPGMNFNEL